MDAAEQVTVQFRVCSGADLPKTNLLGSIDPYVRVLYDDAIVGETKHLRNQAAPVWEEDFFFDANRDGDGYLLGVLRLELYNDTRSKQDELVGTIEIELSEIPPETVDPYGQQQITFHDYALTFQRDKRGEKLSRQGKLPNLSVAFLGAIPSWACMAAQVAGHEEELGLLLDEESQQMYVPVPGGEGAGLYAGMQYLLPRAVHFKLVTVSKQHAGLHLDFKCSKARSLRVERVTYHQRRRKLLKGLRVYAEATLTNLPLSTNIHKLQLVVTSRRAVSSCNVAEALEAAGFPPHAFGTAVSYKKISKEMSGRAVQLDDAASTMYVTAGKPPHSTVLQLDLSGGGGGGSSSSGNGRAGAAGDAGGGGGGAGSGSGSGRLAGFLGGPAVRPVLRVLTMKGQVDPQGRTLLYDFLAAGTETTTSVSETHRRAVKVLDGRYEVVRTAELTGAFDEGNEDLCEAAALVCYMLEAEPLVAFRFTDLFEPPAKEESESEGGILSVLDPENMTVGNMAAMVAVTGGKVVGKVVDLVGQIGDEAPAAGEAVLKVFKAPLRFFRGKDKEKEKDHLSERADSGSSRGRDHSGNNSSRDGQRPPRGSVRDGGQRAGSGQPRSAAGGGGSGSGRDYGSGYCQEPSGMGTTNSRERNGSGRERAAVGSSARTRGYGGGGVGGGVSAGHGRGAGHRGRRVSQQEDDYARRVGYEEDEDDY